ncbi:flavin reductase family protein [Paenibacillus sp. NPDC057934]|uniref:flavin reductase family protein n=1 Tax=Paenibacillus sp. NPDC057934 TaxID=3346282 RepID=UPI0036DB4B24
MLQPKEQLSMYSYPGIVASITSRHDGKQNLMAAGWHTLISYQPAIYGISIRKETYSYKLIVESGSFGINFLPSSRSNWIQAAGTFSGNQKNKFKEFDISYRDGNKLDIPILTDAYGAYECKILDIHSYGSHEFITGEIVQAHRDDSLFQEDGIPDFTKLQIPLYLGRSTYLTVDDTLKSTDHLFYLEKNE